MRAHTNLISCSAEHPRKKREIKTADSVLIISVTLQN